MGGVVKHGMRQTLIYKIWLGIMSRCYIKSATGYKNYGGRGIKVCKRWHSFQNFYTDMGEKPYPNYSIDRINNNKDYSKKNCRWSSPIEQANNKTNSLKVKVFDEVFSLSEAAKLFAEVNYETAKMRIHRGKWPSLSAVLEPKQVNQYTYNKGE